jgi:hypothetical protein
VLVPVPVLAFISAFLNSFSCKSAIISSTSPSVVVFFVVTSVTIEVLLINLLALIERGFALSFALRTAILLSSALRVPGLVVLIRVILSIICSVELGISRVFKT